MEWKKSRSIEDSELRFISYRSVEYGGRIKGSFDLVSEGTGTYALQLRQYIGKSFLNAEELIDQVRGQGGIALNCTHILNRNKLRIDKSQQ